MITAPFFIVTVVLMLPLPLTALHAVVTLPPDPALVTAQVQLPIVMPAGAESTTVALVTSVGPLLVTMIVYVVEAPALTVPTPLLLTIARSAFGGVVCVVVLLLTVPLAPAPADAWLVIVVATPSGAVTLTWNMMTASLATPPAAFSETSVPPSPVGSAQHAENTGMLPDTGATPAVSSGNGLPLIVVELAT